MILGSHYRTALVMAKIWVIFSLAGADLTIYRENAGEQRKCISVVLAGSCHCPTSDGLHTV
jgi:hypothetical protein